MSFSREVKDEILEKISLDMSGKRRAFISGIFRNCGSVAIISNVKKIVFELGNAVIAMRLASALKEEFSAAGEMNMKSEGMDRCVTVSIPYGEELLEKIGIVSASADGSVFTEGIGLSLDSKEEIVAYVQAQYLLCGRVSVPSDTKKSGYHLEMIFKDGVIASEIADKLAEIEISLKKVERNEEYALYIKESDTICDFIYLMGASKSYFALQELILSRSQKNNANRLGNCKAANALKVADSGVKHILAIQYLKDTGEIGRLTDKLKEVADLRVEYPMLSLEELAAKVDPPISKSGLNHRLTKIVEIADELKREGKHG